jgi:hypothetical protein
MPITSQPAAEKSDMSPEKATASFVHPLVSARGKKNTTTFLPTLSAIEKDPVSVGMVKGGSFVPVSSMVMISRVLGSIYEAGICDGWPDFGVFLEDGKSFNDRKTVCERRDTNGAMIGR